MDDMEDREPKRRRPLGRSVSRALLAIGLVLAGTAGGFVWSEWRASNSRAAKPNLAKEAPQTPVETAQAASSDSELVEITLTSDAVARAGIKTAPAQSERAVQSFTVPGTVMSNAYRETRVNGLVGGVITRVSAELGSPARRGEPLAVIFSNELAEAQMKYLSMRAMLEADRQKHERVDKLVALGAASRQELEEVTAVHAAHETEAAAARQRLLLLGLTPEQVAQHTDASHVISEVVVRSPADGVVITRSINPGQVVGAGQDLFVVADLSTVWVIGDLYEKDFGSVGVGSPATVIVPAAPRETLRGRVAYIDPRVDPATRTAKVRVEAPNRAGGLRLGMYVNLAFESGGGERRVMIPRSAVQSVGERTVVYVPVEENEGQFVERSVTLGPAIGDRVQVMDGLRPGEPVVAEGSFFLRAEATRARSGG
jgi:RND family efflux transporter MFP subunit